MALSNNQFTQEVIEGFLDNLGARISLPVKVNANSATLVPGSAVKLVDIAGKDIQVRNIELATDNIFGIVHYQTKRNQHTAGDYLEIIPLEQYGIVHMVAGAAIARGASVEVNATTRKVITSAGTNAIIGLALDKAAADGDLIRVLFVQKSIAIGSTTNLTISGNFTAGGTTSSTGNFAVNTDKFTVAAATGNTVIAGTTLLTGATTANVLLLDSDTRTGAGAVSVTKTLTKVVTTGTDALTLADGTENQVKIITMITDGGDGTLTPANLTGGTTIAFDNIGDTVTLVFVGGSWNIVSNNGCTVA